MKLSRKLKSSMKSVFFTVVLTALCSVASFAQTLNIYNVNASAFPKVTASYVAFDNAGVPITGLEATDFSVVETQADGTQVNVTPTLTHDCETQTEDPEASVILILDRSQSMNEIVGGKKRFTYAKDAIRAFVAQMRFNGESRVCLVTFTGNYEVVVDWTNDRNAVYTELDLIEPLTSTDYTLPFRSPDNNIYEKFKERPADIPKYAFFLTDGVPNPGIDDEVAFVNDNTALLGLQAIRFFAITIVQPNAHWTIATLAQNSGGKSIVTTEDELVDLFSLLALETQVRETCQLTWIAPFGCGEKSRPRTAIVTLEQGNNPTAPAIYVAPPSSVASVELSEPIVFCGDPAANQSSTARVTLTARNAPLSVDGFTITPNTFFSVKDWDSPRQRQTFAPFTINPGQSRTLEIEFTQGAQQIFRQAILELQGSPCPPSIDLVGGQGLVVLTSPNGGELFSTCDTVVITWAGVLPTQPVKLEYSDDGGNTWKPIANDATGLKYEWQAPRPGTEYKVRVSVSPTPQYQWADRLGGAGDETATAVAVLSNDINVFTTGYFDGPAKFGDLDVNSAPGDIDGYYNQWTADGQLVATTILDGAGTNADRMNGVVADDLGNHYVIGSFESSTARFGSQTLTKGTGDGSNMFIYKIEADGSIGWNGQGQGSGLNTSWANATRVGYRYLNGALQVVVQGQFERFIRVGPAPTGGWQESDRYTNTRKRDYYVIYDVNGRPIDLRWNARPDNSWTFQDVQVFDSNGFRYETGNYTGNKSFSPPRIDLGNFGGQDVYLSKYGSIPASDDESETVFTVSAPKLEFTIPSVAMDATQQGQTSSKSFTGILCNTGDHPVELGSTGISGTDRNDFRLLSPPVGTRVGPGECLTVELEFIPSDIGPRAAQLDITGACGSAATLQISGVGEPGCSIDVIETVDLGTIPLGSSQAFPIACVLRNTGPVDLAGTLTGTGSPDLTITLPGNPSPFTLTPNAPGDCLDVTINVNALTVGRQVFTLEYGLDEAECGKPTTIIEIEVVEPNVNITNVDFGRVRLGLTADDVVTIANLSDETATITNVNLTDPSNPNFVFTNVPTAQFTLASNETRDINVRFQPQTRGPHTVNVEATVQGQTELLVSTVTGIGILPSIAATGYTFAATTVGVTSAEIGEVIIRNTDPETDLIIASVAFETATTDFAWDAPLPGFPQTIAPGADVRFPVNFTPQAAGNRTVNVRIEHDVIPGATPPFADTLVVLNGLGVESSDLPPVDFGNVLTCITRSQEVTIVNPNPTSELRCDTPIGSGDIAAFTLSETGPFVVAPGGSTTITVFYTPTAVGPQSASYSISNDQGLSLTINTNGTGITTNADFRYYNIIQGTVGQTMSTPVEVNLITIDEAEVESIELTFTFPAEYVTFADLTTPEQVGWSFATDATTPGTLIVTGTSDPGVTLTSGPVVTPRFNVYLTSEEETPIKMTAATSLNCLVATGDSTAVSISRVCYNEGRLVKLGDAQFSIGTPAPNPARETTTLEYSTGIELSTTFELVDATGNVVQKIVTPVLGSGHYTLTLKTAELATGLYFLRMSSGPYVETRRISIVK